MATQKCKLAFWALALTCLMQTTASPPSPLASGEKVSAPPKSEIVGHAASEIFKSFGDLFKSSITVIKDTVVKGIAEGTPHLYLRTHIIMTASGVQDATLNLTQEQYFEYRVVACTLLRLRQKLDVMERVEKEYESILAEASIEFLALPLWDRNQLRAVLGSFFSNMTGMADRRLRQHQELRKDYLRIRGVVQIEEASVTMIIWDTEKYIGDIRRLLEFKNDFERLLESLPEPRKNIMTTAIVNKEFLHHSVNRATIRRKEDFVMARSTLELSKKLGKAEMVQQVYDKTLREVTTFLVSTKANDVDKTKGLFTALRSNFEANPPLNQEWREMQKYVSQSHDWDTNIWDLDLAPF